MADRLNRFFKEKSNELSKYRVIFVLDLRVICTLQLDIDKDKRLICMGLRV